MRPDTNKLLTQQLMTAAALASGSAQRQKFSAQEFPPDNLVPGEGTSFGCAELHESAAARDSTQDS